MVGKAQRDTTLEGRTIQAMNLPFLTPQDHTEPVISNPIRTGRHRLTYSLIGQYYNTTIEAIDNRPILNPTIIH